MATWKKLAYEDDVPLKTLWAAKGTIVAASGANTPAGVAVGTDGQLIVADAASAGGIKWQTGAIPAAHKTSHQDGGADEISVAALSGLLADDQHVLDAEVTAVAIAKALVTEQGDIIYASAASTPAALAHGTSGQALLTGGHGANPSWGAPAVAAHATTHKLGGADVILLNEFGLPTAAVALNGQQATNLVIHEVANAAALAALTAVVGKVAFQVDTLAFYICTAV